jgi:RimJ/RimL family protein N-acetyltransferase
MSTLLNGPRVRLTALRAEDFTAIAGWYTDAEFLRLFDSRPAIPQTAGELRKWVEEHRKGSCAFFFGVRLKQEDELIGYLELDGIQRLHGVCGLGIGIGAPEHRGRGYGAEAVRLALNFAFDELNMHRVQLTVFSYNKPAAALYERLGFRREGTFRECLQRDGQRHDMFLYGLLRREWAERRTPQTCDRSESVNR